MENSKMANGTISGFHLNYTNVTHQASNYSLAHKADGIDYAKFVTNGCIIPAVILIGLVGNALSIIIFNKEKKRGASAVFIIGLALSDTVFLIIKLIYCVYAVGHIFFMESFRFVRPNSLFFANMTLGAARCSTVFIIVISLERLTGVYFPFQLRTVWTRKRALYLSIVIAMVVFVLTALLYYEMFMFTLTEDIPKQGKIATQKEAVRYLRTQSTFSKTLDMTLVYLLDIIPLCLVMLLNMAIIVGIKMSFRAKNSSGSAALRGRSIEKKTTRTLLSLCISYCILCGPFQLYVMLVIVRIIKTTDVPFFCSEMFRMMVVLNSVINFIVYGVTDQKIRKKYFLLLQCSKSIGKASGELNSTTEGPINSTY